MVQWADVMARLNTTAGGTERIKAMIAPSLRPSTEKAERGHRNDAQPVGPDTFPHDACQLLVGYSWPLT
jgi:hypothetical protein